MCELGAGTGRRRVIPRPRWGQLYASALLPLAVLAAVQTAAPGGWRVAAEVAVVLGVVALMAGWVGLNQVALEQQDDCGCGRVTERVIASSDRWSRFTRTGPGPGVIRSEEDSEILVGR